MDESVVAGLTTRLLDFKGPKHLALDRTNWKLGRTDINILVLAVVTPKFKIHVMWSFMDHRGNSSTSQRIDLMKRYIDVVESREKMIHKEGRFRLNLSPPLWL